MNDAQPIPLADDEKQLLFLLAERHTARATAMLEKHPDLSHRNIMVAAAVGDADEVRAMLDAGANANAYVLHNGDHNARIPVLYFACTLNHVEVARALLEAGANPNDGESVYHAAEHNHRDCLQLLLDHGANISQAHSTHGNTPLYFLTGFPSNHPHFATVLLGTQWLLEHGADPNVASYLGRQNDGTEGSGELPLHRAASHKDYTQMARLLVKHGAHVDAPRADGRTAYALAVREGRAGMAEYLASAGADTTKLSTVDRFLGACSVADETTARAIVSENPALVASLSPADRNAIVASVAEGRVASAKLMFALGWSLSEESIWGGTPLHWAAWHGRDAMVRMLLEMGAAVNVRDSTFGSSPIAWACHGSTNSRPGHDADYLAVVDQLLDAGSTRPESFNNDHDSPESMASPAVAERLRERGFTT